MGTPENLYLRGKVWWIRYASGGQMIRRSLETKSVREAKRLRDEILGARTRAAVVREKFGLEPAATDEGNPIPTFGDVCDRWLEFKRASNIRDKRYVHLVGQVENWFRPRFGSRLVTSITLRDVTQFRGELRSAKAVKGDKLLTATYRAVLLRQLKAIFKFAIREGYYSGHNPADVPPDEVRVVVEEPPTLTHEQAQRFVTALQTDGEDDGQLARMAFLALETGLRWGEVSGLRWVDVDLDGELAVISVKRSYQGPPKNRSAMNPIKLQAGITAELRRWEAASTSEYVFLHPNGKPFKSMPHYYRDRVFAAARKAGVADYERFTPHCLRHTFGSWEYERTGDAKYVQRVMRHANILTTLQVYVHDGRDDGAMVAERPAAATLGPKLQIVR